MTEGIEKTDLNTLPEKTEEKKEGFDLSTLTEGNWKFLHYLSQGLKPPEAYKLAGYSGNASQPYKMAMKLRKALETIHEADSVNRARILGETSKLLDMPLEEGKTSLKYNEKMRLLKFASSLVPDMESPKKQLSVLIINRYQDQKGPSPISVPQHDAIDVEVVND
jgi:hypothetical protein